MEILLSLVGTLTMLYFIFIAPSSQFTQTLKVLFSLLVAILKIEVSKTISILTVILTVLLTTMAI